MSEDQVLEELLVDCWAHDVLVGQRPQSLDQARAALKRWTEMGLVRWVEREGVRYTDNFALHNAMKEAGFAADDPVFRRHYFRTLHASADPFRLFVEGYEKSQAGPVAPSKFEVSFRRDINLSSKATGAKARIRLPLPWNDRAQRDIELAVLAPEGAKTKIDDGRLSVEMAVPKDPQVSVELKFSMTAYHERYNIDPEKLTSPNTQDPDAELFLREKEGPYAISPFVSNLARELSGDVDNPWFKLERFWSFLFESFKVGYIHAEELEGECQFEELLRRGWTDCYLSSALLMCLCRSSGIPARLVSGIHLYPEMPQLHFWLEVLLKPYGWVPVDFAHCWALAGGDLTNAEWGRYLLAGNEYRLKNQCYPRLVTGPIGIKMPGAWRMTRQQRDGWTEVAFHDLKTGEHLYTDHTRVRWLDSTSAQSEG